MEPKPIADRYCRYIAAVKPPSRFPSADTSCCAAGAAAAGAGGAAAATGALVVVVAAAFLCAFAFTFARSADGSGSDGGRRTAADAGAVAAATAAAAAGAVFSVSTLRRGDDPVEGRQVVECVTLTSAPRAATPPLTKARRLLRMCARPRVDGTQRIVEESSAGRPYRARARARRCCCPPESVTPRSPTSVASPCGRASMSARSAHASMAASS